MKLVASPLVSKHCCDPPKYLSTIARECLEDIVVRMVDICGRADGGLTKTSALKQYLFFIVSSDEKREK